MRASPSLSKRLPTGGKRHRLESTEIRDLVEAIHAGYGAPSNLERTGSVWRLRVTVNKPEGGTVRRGITVRDTETALWITNYLERARAGWRDHCREEREKARADAD